NSIMSRIECSQKVLEKGSSKEDVLDFLKNGKEWCESVFWLTAKWELQSGPSERLVWIRTIGVLLQVWCEEFFKLLTQQLDLKGKDKLEGMTTSTGEDGTGIAVTPFIECFSESLGGDNNGVDKGILMLANFVVLEVGQSSLHPKGVKYVILDRDNSTIRKGKKKENLFLKPSYHRSIIGGKNGVGQKKKVLNSDDSNFNQANRWHFQGNDQIAAMLWNIGQKIGVTFFGKESEMVHNIGLLEKNDRVGSLKSN
ncbi:hypothetical protein TanjilG_31068, partial [Lupinus angustifolius]